ncbi:transporter belonging to the mfs superfamily [Nannochloropsis oceanica]
MPPPVLQQKSASSLRWVILLAASLLMLSNYFVYDIPASLKDLLRQNMGLDKADFEPMYSLLYTVYSLPNIVLPFFGGIFVDKFGARICLIAFTLFLLAGQLFFALGGVYKSFPLMLLGRTIYGLGGENMSVAQSSLVAEWFRGKELAFAFGINLSCSRLGSVINNFVEPEVADAWGGANGALFFGVGVLCIGLLCGLVMAPVDKLHALPRALPPSFSPAVLLVWQGAAANEIFLGHVLDLGLVLLGGVRHYLTFQQYCILAAAGARLLPHPPPSCTLTNSSACQSPSNPPSPDCPSSSNFQPPLPDMIQVKDIDCSLEEWSGPGACTQVFCEGQKAGIRQSDRIMSIPYTISAVLSPFLGLAVDRFGRRAVVIALAPVVLIGVHLSLAYWRWLPPSVPLVGQGLAYSAFAAVLWPSVPFTVPEDRVGVAYGLTTAIQNGGLALFPLLAAAIYKAADSHYLPHVELLFVCLAIVGVFCGLLLNFLDARAGQILNRPQPAGGGGLRGGEERPGAKSNKKREPLLHEVVDGVKVPQLSDLSQPETTTTCPVLGFVLRICFALVHGAAPRDHLRPRDGGRQGGKGGRDGGVDVEMPQVVTSTRPLTAFALRIWQRKIGRLGLTPGGGGGELEKWANLMQDDFKAMCMCGSRKIYCYTWPHPPLPFVWHDGLIAVSTTITITSGRASPPQAAARQQEHR